MPNPDLVLLQHMLQAITRVEEVVERFSKDELLEDWMVQDSLIHELQILGEAAGKISKELLAANPEVPWSEMTALRHKIVHDYFVIELEVVWDTARIDVPAVRPLIQSLISRVQPD